MRKSLSVLFVGAAASLTMVTAPAAHAAGDTVTGGCFDHTVIDPILTNGLYEGVMGDSSVTQDSSGPVFATVLCYIRVNGLELPNDRGTYSGTGSQSGSEQIAYSAGPGDVAELCQDVVFADGFDTGLSCQPA